MAVQTLILQKPAVLFCQPRVAALSGTPKPTTLHFKPRPISSPRLSRRSSVNSSTIRTCSSTVADVKTPTHSILTGSTRTVTTLLAITITASKFLAQKFLNFASPLPQSVIKSVGPAFFASRSVSTPFTVVAMGLAKWLDIYYGVLMVRVLLSWFPNIPWDRQPFSAVRDLCDPYLNLFRNLIPPIFNTLDVSPILAFLVMGLLASILKTCAM